MRKRLGMGLAACAVIAAVGFGVSWYIHGRFVESTDNAIVDGDIVSVTSKVSGRINAVNVIDNQPVHSGDLLFSVDDADYRAAFDQQVAALAAAKAAVAVADANVVVANNAVIEAEAALNSAKAEKTRARADLSRYAKLSKRQFASQQKLQSSRADATKASAEVARVTAALATEKARLGLYAAQRDQAAAEAAAKAAALEAARIRLADTVVYAPAAGVVGNKGVQVGQYLSVGQQAMSIVPVAKIFVVANYKETQVAHMRPGQPVEIEVDAYKGKVFTGVVDSVAPGSGSMFSLLPAENATGNFTKIVQRFPVKIRFEPLEQGALLLPGMSVEARVNTKGFAGLLSQDNAFSSVPSAIQTAEQK